MKKEYVILIIVVLALLNLFQLGWSIFAHKLPLDAIPTEKEALEVGKALLVSIYGESVLSDTPFIVKFDKKRNAWIVCGTLPDNYVGGSPGIVFRKNDGKILHISFGM